MIYHLFFEQSGTFKNILKGWNYEAYDYDIRNDFGQTDCVMDLFAEIEKGYADEPSLFDRIKEGGVSTIMAFFPCVRFEEQILLHFRGDSCQLQNRTTEEKLEVDLKLQAELTLMYNMITKLAIVCIKKEIPLIIENPYSQMHYLRQRWCIRPSVIDMDRRQHGDYYKKPTQYWFIGTTPKENIFLEQPKPVPIYTITSPIPGTNRTVARSLIHPQYAEWFLKTYVIDKPVDAFGNVSEN